MQASVLWDINGDPIWGRNSNPGCQSLERFLLAASPQEELFLSERNNLRDSAVAVKRNRPDGG